VPETMLQPSDLIEQRGCQLRVSHRLLHFRTSEYLEFIDITGRVIDIVEKSGIQNGWVNIQTKHTTTAIVVNEHEPLLLRDMKRILESLAPRDGDYLHNDLEIRTANKSPDERQNGHSHCQALFLRTSETVNIMEGMMQLGPWQRIFLIELDGSRDRTVSVMIMGDDQ
jgi:secondary thiamine-phosphate synthase enzyme